MADYDWFAPSDSELRERNRHAKDLIASAFEEVGYPNVTLVCTLCGSVIYGRLGGRYANSHRERCFVQEQVNGKHRSD